MVEAGSRWIEVGCAASSLLLDMPTRLGAELDGVDISADALDATRHALAEYGLNPKLRCHDFAHPADDELNAYDGVVSLGFVEHFADLAATFVDLGRYVKRGGLVVTVVPNMAGLNGFLQLCLDRPIFLTHHVVTPPVLRQEMERAGLRVEACQPLLAFNLGVVNVGERRNRPVGRALEAGFVGLSRAVWMCERVMGRRLAATLWRSPYIICVGRCG